MLKRLVVGLLVLGVHAAMASPATAHGEIVRARPAADTQVRRPPRGVRLVLAEAPAARSGLRVVDGCGDIVSGDPQRSGKSFSVALDGGGSGRWRVRLRSVSAVDGHVVSDGFTFRVAGKRDCPAGRDGAGDQAQVDTSSRPPIENEDRGSRFPIVPLALGAAVVVGVAVALRGGSRERS